MKYLLDKNHKPYKVDDVLKWGKGFESIENRCVALYEKGDIRISTVFLGLDHNYCETGPPLLFETMVFDKAGGPMDETMEDGWEGCLSVPGMRGLVPRYSKIEYSGFNASGESIKVKAEGFHARVVQHECDHLDGILYPQRIRDFTRFGFIDELAEAGLFACDTPDE